MNKFTYWLFWRVVYCFRRTPRTFDGYLTRAIRCWWPWKKFQPSAFHNDDGNQWHIYLVDEQSYTVSRQSLQVELHIGMETGEITGFNVWDETLEAAGKRLRLEGGDS